MSYVTEMVYIDNLSRDARDLFWGLPTRPDTNRAISLLILVIGNRLEISDLERRGDALSK